MFLDKINEYIPETKFKILDKAIINTLRDIHTFLKLIF